MKVASAAQMREMDRQSIKEFGVPGIVLMENAALRVVDSIVREYGPIAKKKIAVVCGKGNNGGDGFAIARHLATRFDADVTIWLLADPKSLKGDAATNYQMANSFELVIHTLGTRLTEAFSDNLAHADLIVDALFGTGFKGAADGIAAHVIDAMNASPAPTIAVDIPSGLNADTGEIAGPCVCADRTVTFALPKVGLLLYPGVDQVGVLEVADIAMPRQVMQAEDVLVSLTEASEVAQWLPSRVPGRDSNKGTFGHVTILAGSAGLLGAAMMSAEAATRTGSGLLTLALPQSLIDAAMSQLSPVIMTRGFAETSERTFSMEGLAEALKLAERGTAAAIGPGLGTGRDPETAEFVREFIARCSVPLVIDADALTVLSEEPDRGMARLKSRKAGTVLTPHPGEMARLLGVKTPDVQTNRRAVVEKASQDYQCVVLLKGSRTLIASPDGALAINPTGNPGMATGGAGDVLTGVIGSLLAQKLEAREAAIAGAYLHGLAGDLVAQAQGGSAGLIATDLIGAMPRAIAACTKD